ncbi:MAG: HAMP domain-containing protein, partial [Planctomycetota bacterium]|nr:HAMP domain-containing protein [Planctomycetota bacterium]
MSYDAGQSARSVLTYSYRSEDAMVSLTYKLSGIFLAISLVPLVIGIAGVLSLQSIGRALDRNNSALEHLSRLIASANDSLADNIRIQANFREATDQVSQTQQIANATFRDMRDLVLPRTFALANIRYSLIDANEARLAMFLLLTMRHLDFATQNAGLEIQKTRLSTAMAGIWNASEAYTALMVESDMEINWETIEEKLTAWRENHSKFMQNMAKMEQLNRDLVRGGPLFAAASRTAFETAFVEGSVIRAECEKILDEMNNHITRLTTNSIRRALLSQIRSQYLVETLTADSQTVIGKTEELRAQIASAGETSAVAARESETALAATASRFRYMSVFSAIGIILAIALGITQAVRISRPIRVMAAQMTRLAIGDMTSDVPASSLAMRDEVGQLAHALQGLINSNRTEIRLADAMATGDYTLRVNLRSESDQLGRALATMVRNSNETLSGVTLAIHRMANSADSVANASNSLSQGALTSAAALEEIASSITNVDQQAKENAGHASQANQLATSSRDAAKRGYNAVSELVAAM